jgi:hypothetical protein
MATTKTAARRAPRAAANPKLFEPMSIEAALRPTEVDIDVPAKTELTLDLANRDFARVFRVGRVSSFEDLRMLGYVPEGLDEGEAVEAVRADTAAALREARTLVQGGFQPNECSCHDASAAPVAGYREQVDQAYRTIRGTHHDHLIEVMQPHLKVSVTHRHPAVGLVRRRLERWLELRERWLIGIVALRDINIGDNATLHWPPITNALYARDINIGSAGHLKFQGGSVKVRCHAVNGPTPIKKLTAGLVVGNHRMAKLTASAAALEVRS